MYMVVVVFLSSSPQVYPRASSLWFEWAVMEVSMGRLDAAVDVLRTGDAKTEPWEPLLVYWANVERERGSEPLAMALEERARGVRLRYDSLAEEEGEEEGEGARGDDDGSATRAAFTQKENVIQ